MDISIFGRGFNVINTTHASNFLEESLKKAASWKNYFGRNVSSGSGGGGNFTTIAAIVVLAVVIFASVLLCLVCCVRARRAARREQAEQASATSADQLHQQAPPAMSPAQVFLGLGIDASDSLSSPAHHPLDSSVVASDHEQSSASASTSTAPTPNPITAIEAEIRTLEADLAFCKRAQKVPEGDARRARGKDGTGYVDQSIQKKIAKASLDMTNAQDALDRKRAELVRLQQH